MLPLVISVEHTSEGHVRRFAFADSPVRIGRSPFAELQLGEPFISRWEGTLRFDETQITYFNLSSTNPTLVNGRPLAANEEVPVGTDTVVTLGELTLRFARVPVPESDLRRKGKRRPVIGEAPEAAPKTQWLGLKKAPEEDPRSGAKTQWLNAASLRKALTDTATEAQSRGEATPRTKTLWLGTAAPPPTAGRNGARERGAALGQDVRTAPPASDHPRPQSERPAGAPAPAAPVRVLGQRTIVPSSRPPAADTSQTGPLRTDHVDDYATGGLGTATSSTASTPSGLAPLPPGAENLEFFHEQYRERWAALLSELTVVLERTPEDERAKVADRLQRRYPQITLEPEFRALLKRFHLEARRADIPQLSDWLSSVAEGILPPNLRLDTGLTLERILNLLEMLSESFADINEAQESVRRRWLGRAPRGSILHSDNGRVILAYLLNPKADWAERASELEEALGNVVMHEIALFKATLEGAKGLLDALSPEALAEAENVNLEELEDDAGGAGFWQRLKREDPKALLWRRFVTTYESLKDGARFQRVFMGRKFARTYLAAMGQADSGGTEPSSEE